MKWYSYFQLPRYPAVPSIARLGQQQQRSDRDKLLKPNILWIRSKKLFSSHSSAECFMLRIISRFCQIWAKVCLRDLPWQNHFRYMNIHTENIAYWWPCHRGLKSRPISFCLSSWCSWYRAWFRYSWGHRGHGEGSIGWCAAFIGLCWYWCDCISLCLLSSVFRQGRTSIYPSARLFQIYATSYHSQASSHRYGNLKEISRLNASICSSI